MDEYFETFGYPPFTDDIRMYEVKDVKTQKEMMQELYQAIIGIPENPDENGLIGKMDDLGEKLDSVNGKTRGNEIRSKVNQSVLSVVVTVLLGGGAKLLGWW